MVETGIEDRLNTGPHAFCEHKSELYYRVRVQEKGKSVQYCALSEYKCPYFKKDGNHELCTNYK